MALVFPNRSYAGGAVPTQLQSTMNSADGTGSPNPAISLGSLVGWVEVDNPSNVLGTSGGYVLAFDYGLPNEEKVYIPLGVTGTTLNNSGVIRGYDGTTATTHFAGAVVAVVWSANDAAEANVAARAVRFAGVAGQTDDTLTGLITGGGSQTNTLNGVATTVARQDHGHNIPSSVITAVVKPNVAGAGTGSGAITGTTPVTLTTLSNALTGFSTYMWVAKGHTTVGVSTNTEWFFNITGASGGGGITANTAGYQHSVANGGPVDFTLAGNGLITGLNSATAYTFGLSAYSQNTITSNTISRVSFTVVGIA
jgi:hypothetical protein